MIAIQLGEICHFEKGITGLAKATPGIYPLVTTGSERRTCDTYQFDTKAVCIPLVSSTGHGHASIKNVHYQEGKFALGSILVALTAKDENQLDIQYLHLYLSELKNQILVPLMSGAANVSLSISKIKGINIPLPNIRRQREIVQKFNIIKHEDSHLKLELLNQQILLGKLRDCILQEAIEGKLSLKWREEKRHTETGSELLKRISVEKENLIKSNKIKAHKLSPSGSNKNFPFDIPDEWVWCSLGDVIYYADNLDIQKKLSPETLINYVDIDAIDNVKHQIKEVKQKRVAELSTRARRVLRKDFIIYSTVRPYLKNIAIVEDDMPNMIGSTGFNVFKPILVLKEFIFIFLLSPNLNSTYKEMMAGFNSPSITNDQFEGTSFPLPSLIEQHEIVNIVKALLAICDRLEEKIITNKIHAENLIQTFLKECFSQNEIEFTESDSESTYA